MYLQANHISFWYLSQKQVLDDISFEIEKGDSLAIIGASGCGKSTLLRILSGILPDKGKQTLKGKININNKTPDEYRQGGKLAFMFQEASLMPNLTVKQNISLPLKIKGAENEEKVNGLLKIVGLSEFADYLPKHLSGGMKTRVALARSFVTEPELLLLDEPFSALDIAWKSELYKELNILKGRYGTTVVFVTHDIDEAITLAGKNIIVLNKVGSTMLDVRLNGVLNIREEIKHKIITDHNLLFVDQNEK